ncbi:FtsX-like permease family protein [Fulvivirga sp. M361]|uniref:ABC transporter permease n=1 Tax=Fulvivirga sp. M361 TaxID=2594266 RepID=UPI00117A6C3D|nr:ABC transporter permease [Fulvivirga sp. M361]TRX56268.1 FtsX-like permease family protein [Fulvivirga sp. M361]
MVKNYILIAFRNIWKYKTISFINIFGLAVSMSVCLLLIMIIMDQLAYDNFHTRGDRIHRVITYRNAPGEDEWRTCTAPLPLAELLESHESIEKVTRIKKRFKGLAKAKSVDIPFEGLYTDNIFFQIFDFPLKSGDVEEVFTTPNSIVLTTQLAQKLFGDEEPLNQTLEVADMGVFVVTAVLEKLPGKSHMEFDALASLDFVYALEKNRETKISRDNWGGIYSNYIYFLLKQGASDEDLVPLLTSAKSNYPAGSKYDYQFLVQSLKEITPGPLLSNMIGFSLPIYVIYFLAGLALIVLMSACFNYTNLTLARAVNRAREIGVRKVVGARKWQITTQFVTESVVISIIAFIFADLAAQYLLPVLNTYLGGLGAPFRIDATPGIYWAFIIFSLLTGCLAGFFPSFLLSKTNVLVALKKSIDVHGLTRGMNAKRFSLSKVLVVIQFALSVFFIITVFTLYKQMNYVMREGHSFNIENIVKMTIQGIDYELLKQRLSQYSDIRNITAVSHLPALGSNLTMEVRTEGRQEKIAMDYFAVEEDYFATMNIPLVAGRDFPESATDTSRVEQHIILNETAVQKIGWESPLEAIGKTISYEKNDLEVIGVVSDHHYLRLNRPLRSLGFRKAPSRLRYIVVATSAHASALKTIEAEWRQLSNRPFDYVLYEQDLRSSYGQFTILVGILGYVSVIVISIACLGLLGIVIFHIQNKSKEIGVRKVMGASGRSIFLTIGRGFFILLVLAYVIGGVLAYFTNNLWLSYYTRRIDFGFGIITLGFGCVLIIGFTTI